MEKSTMRVGARSALADLIAGMSPVGLEQLRLDRLFELRALIDSLRLEHAPHGRTTPSADARRGT